MIRNIFWDVDGVLFDTHHAITYAFSRSLNEMGLTIAMNEIDGLVRKSIEDCIAALSRRFKLDPDLLRLRFGESYLMIPSANQSPFPGIREVCELIQRQGGRNVIITHRSVESAQKLVNVHCLDHLINGIFSTELGYPCKPDPSILEAAIKRFRLARGESLLIGSHDIDIQAGRTAGVHTCLFGDARLSQPAEKQIIHYNELLAWLEKQL